MASNCGERSFSSLKQIMTDQRSSMTTERLCNLARMAMYPERLRAISNKTIVDEFHKVKNRRHLKRILEGSTCWSLKIWICLGWGGALLSLSGV